MDTESICTHLGGASTALCECCQRQLYSFRPDWKLGHRAAKSEPHHETIEALVKSAASCPLCEKLLASLSADAHRLPAGNWHTSPFYIPTCAPPALFSTSRDDGYIQIRCKEQRCLRHRGAPVKLVPETDTLLGRAVWRERYPSFVSRLARVKEWLSMCLEKHTLCGRSDDDAPRLPTRVLDVGVQGDGTLRLLVSKSLKARYAALSHCWGTAPVPRTTRSTLKAYTNTIPLECLTKTFRDAVEVTRLLGIRYLWVDSLCIIQDCPDDWEQEGAQMASVYRNSFITLAATASPDGSGGLIQPVGSPTACFEVEGFGWRAREHLQWDYTAHSMLREPLNRRAWTLQEAFLSPRLLHFASDQMHWECYCLKESEDGLNGLRDIRMPEFDGDKVMTYAENAGIFSLRASIRAYEVLGFRYPGEHDEHWDNIMEDYTTRRLTYRKDKLPALAGITQHFSGVKDDVPVLGMWRRSLPRNLLWHVRRFGQRPSAASSSDPCGALPSWTFLSLDEAVVMKPSWVDSGRTGPFEPEDVEILEASVAWEGLAMTSRLASSTLRVRGKLCRARRDGGSASARDEPNRFRILPFDASREGEFEDSLGRSLGECWLDAEPVGEEKKPETIWFLKLGRIAVNGGRSERISIRGYRAGVLALRPVAGRENVFSRIGAGFISRNSRFDDSEDGDGTGCFGEHGVEVRCIELV